MHVLHHRTDQDTGRCRSFPRLHTPVLFIDGNRITAWFMLKQRCRYFLVFLFCLLSFTGAAAAATDSVTIHPAQCTDSGGDCTLSNVDTQDNVNENQNGHPSQTRFIETVNDNSSAVTKPDVINAVFASIDRHETSDDGDATIRLVITRPSDETNEVCDLAIDNTEDNQYDRCNVTALVTSSATPEADAENLTVNYRTTGLGAGSTMHLDHVKITLNYTDNTPPTITLDHPSDNEWTNTATIDFNHTPTDITSGINACSLNVDGSTVKTDNNPVENQTNNLTHTLSAGSHSWSVNCTDTSANTNEGESPTRTVNVDTTPPRSITLHPPTPVNDTTVTNATQTFNFTYTDNLAQVATCTLVGDGTDLTSTHAKNNTATTITHDLPDGANQKFHVRCADNATNTNTTEDRFLTVDAKPPSFRNISNTPNTAAALDPNTNITVEANVTDKVTLDTVILQYKNLSTSTFSNTTMQSDPDGPDTFNATFNATTEDTWQYRIWANDTNSNTNVTDTTELAVEWERTWNVTETVPDSHAVLRNDSDSFAIGNITLNNTGDRAINFTVNATRPRITFNGTEKHPLFTVVPGGGDSGKFNVTFNKSGLSIGEHPFTVEIHGTEDATGNSLGKDRFTGKIIIQNVEGPWLSVTITNFANQVTQGDTGVELDAEVENEGTGDAEDIWLAWKLPNGWNLASGTVNKSQTILFTGDTMTNSITVDIGKNAPTGEKTLTAESQANGTDDGTQDSESKTVAVEERSTGGGGDGDGGGGGGGGGGIIVREGISEENVTRRIAEQITRLLSAEQELLDMPSLFEVVRGRNATYTVSLRNPVNQTMVTDLSLRIRGEHNTFFTVDTPQNASIPFNATLDFPIHITAPPYATPGESTVTLRLTGVFTAEAFDFNQSFTRRRITRFLIHTVSRTEATNQIQEAVQIKEEMEENGYGTRRVQQLIRDAQTAVHNNRYDDAAQLIEQVRTLQQQAREARQRITTLTEQVNAYPSRLAAWLQLRRNHFDTRNLLNLARAAAEREDYGTALERAADAEEAFETTEAAFDPVFFLLDWWWVILLGLAGFAVGIPATHAVYRRATITYRIQELNEEEDALLDELEDIQEQYYRGDISRDTFTHVKETVENQLATVQEKRTMLRHRRTHLLKPENIVDDLAEERENIYGKLQQLQKQFYEEERIPRSLYNTLNQIRQERLTEIEEEMLTVKLMHVRNNTHGKEEHYQ